MCPVCTITVAGGLGLSRWLGIDDVITGIWVGALILSTSFWIIREVEKKIKRDWINNLIIISMYLLTLIPLKYAGVIGHPTNQIFKVDKLVFGTVIGSLVFLAGIWADKKERKIKGKQLFSFQKVVFPVAFLAIISLLAYFLL